MWRMPIVGAFLFVAACAYTLPQNWRAYDAAGTDVATAVQHVLERHQLQVIEQQPARVVTGWLYLDGGLTRMRERFVITWEREPGEEAMIVYVRHERQDSTAEASTRGFGTTYHDTDQEAQMLDEITTTMVGDSPPQ